MRLKGQPLLDAMRYLPTIRSRQAELRGYAELRAATKDLIHPIVSIGKLGRTESVVQVLKSVVEKVGPCFIDLNPQSGQMCSDFELFADSTENYKAWRTLAAGRNELIPVALLRDGATERPFIRQVLLIEEAFETVVIRSRRPAQDLPALQAALSAVDDVNNVLVVLDLGYVRGSLEPKTIEASRAITALRLVDPSTRIAVISSSFPRAVSAYGDQTGSMEILERDLHLQLGGNEVAIYGDHASIYPEPFEPSPARWVPRIDFCLHDSWRFERRREDNGGYRECARKLMASPDWDDAWANEVWGAKKITETANSLQTPTGFGSPANWIAARVNMHIERQASDFSTVNGLDEEETGD